MKIFFILAKIMVPGFNYSFIFQYNFAAHEDEYQLCNVAGTSLLTVV